MLFPVKCYTCGKMVGHKKAEYDKCILEGEGAGDVLDKLGMKKYCCRRMYLGFIECSEQILEYKKV